MIFLSSSANATCSKSRNQCSRFGNFFFFFCQNIFNLREIQGMMFFIRRIRDTFLVSHFSVNSYVKKESVVRKLNLRIHRGCLDVTLICMLMFFLEVVK